MEVNLNIDTNAEAVAEVDSDFRSKLRKKQITITEQLKKGIWVYFILLIIEGALRKWIFPALATPLLIVRDPVAVWLLITAWRNNRLPTNSYLTGIYFCTVVSIFAALLFGHGNILVALYGARILLFHFPLIFLIGEVFDREDVIKIGRALVWISIPMALLIALQFYSPQTAFVNKGIGAESEGGGFSGALGYFRPPGTFSFTTGNSQFFACVGVFVIYFFLNPIEIKRYLLIAGAISVLIAIPLSISRTLFFQICLSLVFATVSIARKPKFLGRMVGAIFGLIILVAILSRTEFFEKAIDALTNRFQDADESEGGIQNTFANRIFAGLLEPFASPSLPILGYGIGMGTNAGAQLLVGHSDEFLISEGEWGRLVGEMGAFLGLGVIFIRLRICIQFVIEGYKRLLKSDLLTWMLISVSFLSVAQGQWAQPTALGFGIVMGGITMASYNTAGTTPVNE